MKFPRNARMLKGHLDFAPFASVFFCLLIFVLLASLVYTPGMHMHLPADVPGESGIEGKKVTVELYADGRMYFQGQPISEKDLSRRLTNSVKDSPEPLTIALLEDTNVTVSLEMKVWKLAAAAGITNAARVTLPGMHEYESVQ